jgi:hypothetical protein
VPALDVNLSTRAADATLSGMSAKLPASLGAKARAESLSVALSTEDAAKVPSLGQALAAASNPVVLPLSQLPNASTATPSTTASGVPVRAVPDWAPGKQIHAQTSVGVANAANKLLFGFTNTTGATVYIKRVHISNTQTTSIAGVMCQMNVQIGTAAISGGTTVTPISSPALVASCRDISNALPAGLTFNTNGALGGTVSTIESVRWTTDEVQPNGAGSLSELIFAIGTALDTFDFSDDPIPVANNQSFGVVCDSAASNGSSLIDLNILRP